MKTFKAKEIVVPSDMPERFDAVTNAKPGTFREFVAEKGDLHNIDREVLALGATRLLNDILGYDLPTNSAGDKLSLERFSSAIWFLGFIYALGIVRFDEKTLKLYTGNSDDYADTAKFREADKILLRTGKKMDTEDFLKKLSDITSEEALVNVYKDTVSTKPISRKKEVPQKHRLYAVTSATLEAVDLTFAK